jgi:nucleoside-diphosphate-sugar epimerase
MKVFIAGATGAIGSRLVPRLVAGGYAVVAMTRSPQRAGLLSALGAHPVIADALNGEEVRRALARAEPEVVIHQLTDLAGVKSFRRFDREFAFTNRLRTDGTDNLLQAARAAGSRRFIAQSYGNWIYDRAGTSLKTENDPLDPNPPANQVASMAALRHLELAVTSAAGIEGLALRYANFYGPRTSIAQNGDIVAAVRRRHLPVVGSGGGVWSFIHVDDAAAATIRAIDRGAPGIYNIVDDEPAPVAKWLPELAMIAGAKPPRRVPTWLARIAAGEVGVSMMTQIRGMSNAKAKRELEWRPRFSSFHDGFRAALDSPTSPSGTSFTRADEGPRR